MELNNKRLVFICSPFQGKEENVVLVKNICRNIMIFGDGIVPIAPHLFFPQFLDETSPTEREMGINAGLELLLCVDEMWVFGGKGITEGMKKEIEFAKEHKINTKYFYKFVIDESMWFNAI